MNYSSKTWYHDVLMRVIYFILRHCTAYVGINQITVFQFTQIYTATLPNKKQNTYIWIFIHLNEQKLKLIMLNLILVPLDVLKGQLKVLKTGIRMHNTEVASHNAEYGSNDLVCLCIQLLSQAIFVIDVYGWLLNRKATRYISQYFV